MKQISNEKKREWARSMYLNENKTQAEIAEVVEVSRQTIVRWCKEDHWEEMKATMTMTRQEQIKNLQRQIIEINNGILSRPEGQRYASPKEADTIVKLTTAINRLETECGIHETVSVGQGFIDWLRQDDLDKAKEFARIFDLYIKSLMR